MDVCYSMKKEGGLDEWMDGMIEKARNLNSEQHFSCLLSSSIGYSGKNYNFRILIKFSQLQGE